MFFCSRTDKVTPVCVQNGLVLLYIVYVMMSSIVYFLSGGEENELFIWVINFLNSPLQFKEV